MEKFTLDLPTMYGDHHVIDVRRILFELPGVDDVYASSAFRAVEVTYDPAKVTRETITASLEAAGYAGDLAVPVELGAIAEDGNGKKPFFRHTAVYETTRSVVSFAQQVNYEGRPLWPCPGMGPLRILEPVEE